MIDAARLSLFASLRRDRLLFALVSTLILLLHMLQPLAAAQMPESRHLAICTLHGLLDPGTATGEMPTDPLDKCPVCLIGSTCSSMAACKATLDTTPAFPVPGMNAIAAPVISSQTGPAGPQGKPSPAIRAPPFSA